MARLHSMHCLKGASDVHSMAHTFHASTTFSFFYHILYYWKTEMPLTPPKNNKNKPRYKDENAFKSLYCSLKLFDHDGI
jgi:hypothetical protein